MKTNFYNRNGELSFYSFCCGYVQRDKKENMKKELFMENSTFHVKVYNINDVSVDTIAWNSFHSLTEARKNYKSFKL